MLFSDQIRGAKNASLSTKCGQGYGNFYNWNNTKAISSSYQWDSQPNNGNSVYVRSGFYFYKNGGWTDRVYHETMRTSTASWEWDQTVEPLDPDGSRARAAIQVKEDRYMAPDHYSDTTYPTFDY